jgi:hypothetical protein
MKFKVRDWAICDCGDCVPFQITSTTDTVIIGGENDQYVYFLPEDVLLRHLTPLEKALL